MQRSNTLETGLADETTITTANSDDGTAGDGFDIVTIGAGNGLVYDDLRAAHGSLSARFDLGASSGTVCVFGWSFSNQFSISGSVGLYLTDVPTDSIRIVGWEDTTTAVANGRIVLNTFTGGVIQVLDQAFTGDFATAVVPKNEWVRVDYDLVTHPTQGVIEARLYQGDSVHPVTDGVVRITGKNTASVVNRATYGSNAAWSAAAMSFWMDDAKVYARSQVRSPVLDYDYSR